MGVRVSGSGGVDRGRDYPAGENSGGMLGGRIGVFLLFHPHSLKGQGGEAAGEEASMDLGGLHETVHGDEHPTPKPEGAAGVGVESRWAWLIVALIVMAVIAGIVLWLALS